jgi:hypothetical protein
MIFCFSASITEEFGFARYLVVTAESEGFETYGQDFRYPNKINDNPITTGLYATLQLTKIYQLLPNFIAFWATGGQPPTIRERRKLGKNLLLYNFLTERRGRLFTRLVIAVFLTVRFLVIFLITV